MKAKLALIVFSLILVSAIVLPASAATADDDVQSTAVLSLVSARANSVLTDLLATPSAVPRGPRDVLQAYETEMTAITQRFSAKIATIAEAVNRGELSSEQGQKISAEQYQMAQMQFELLAAWRDMLEQDLARIGNPQLNSPSERRMHEGEAH